jgi:hypothetical protein
MPVCVYPLAQSNRPCINMGAKRGTNPEEVCLKHETAKNCEPLRRLFVLEPPFDRLQTSSSPTLLSSYSRSIAEVIHEVLNSTCREKSYQ